MEQGIAAAWSDLSHSPRTHIGEVEETTESRMKRKALISPSKVIERPSTSKKAKATLSEAFESLALSPETGREACIGDGLHGLSISFDNVNKFKRSFDYYSKKKDEMVNVVCCFAYFNRVPLPA